MIIDIIGPLTPDWFTRDFDDAARLIPDGSSAPGFMRHLRLNDGLTFIGLPFGGETGARIARRRAISVNPDTLTT